MPGIRAVGRIGQTIVPNWRWEDATLDPYQLRIAGWLVSNTTGWTEDHVTRNMIAERTGISAGKVSSSVEELAAQGIISVETVAVPQGDGGKRWRITVYLDVWQRPRSPHDQALVTSCSNPGHQVTATTGISVEVEQESSLVVASQTTSVRHPDDQPTFDAWYDGYPKKQGKQAARKVWDRMSQDDRIAAWNSLAAWNRKASTEGRKYLPMASTFLNQARWEDEHVVEDSAPSRNMQTLMNPDLHARLAEIDRRNEQRGITE